MNNDNIPLYKKEFIKTCKENIKRDGLSALLQWLESSDFFTAPASTKFHGNYNGGLCEHSLNVYKELLRLNELYNTQYDNETLAVVALFHDLCKVNFYKKGKRNVKDETTGQWYSKDIFEIDEKVPLGHGEKSCIILQWFIHLSIEELLAIRWHMGGFDSAVKGGDYSLSRAQDVSKLVSLLNAADLLSSNLIETTIQ